MVGFQSMTVDKKYTRGLLTSDINKINIIILVEHGGVAYETSYKIFCF